MRRAVENTVAIVSLSIMEDLGQVVGGQVFLGLRMAECLRHFEDKTKTALQSVVRKCKPAASSKHTCRVALKFCSIDAPS